MLDKYVYTRKDGGETWCYGHMRLDSNYAVCCEDEELDGIWAGDIDFNPTNWREVCEYLEEHYDSQIVQLETC